MSKKKKRGLIAVIILLLVLGIALAVWLASYEPGTFSGISNETSVPHESSVPPEDETSAVSSDPSDDIPSEESPPDESEYSDEEPYDPPSADMSETSGGSESSAGAPTLPDTSEEEPGISDTSDNSEPEGPPAHVHEWEEATCTAAKTCTSCGATEGSPKGHDWTPADCDTPKTCKACGMTDGSAKGHDWKAATCTAPKACKVCGKTDGVAAGHNWEGATCSFAKTCKSCGVTEGSAKGHDWADATCTSAKTCKVCGKTDGSAKGHSYSKGTCTACGAKDPDYKEAAVHGDTPVVIEVNGVEYTLTSYADAEAVLPMKTEADFVSPEKGFTIYVKSGAVMAGTTYTANGDGTYTTTRGQTLSDNQVTNVFRNFWCSDCGKRSGDGTHGTCVYYLHDDECYECGEAVKALECHTCKEKSPDSSLAADSVSIYNALIAFKNKYPEGTAFDNSVIYEWFYDNCSYCDAGCAAFASELSIEVFGTEAYVELTDITIADVRVGDSLRINGNTHTVIVLEVYSDYIVIAEANFNGKVHWGRTLTESQVANANYLISRYVDRLK